MILARCGGDRAEDLLHFLWECPAYDHIRDEFSDLFCASFAPSASECMRKLFNTRHQRRLARCVTAMDAYRRLLLGRGQLFGLRPRLQPVGYAATLSYPACLQRGAGLLDVVSPWLGPLWACQDTVGVVIAALTVAGVWVFTCLLAYWGVATLSLWLS